MALITLESYYHPDRTYSFDTESGEWSRSNSPGRSADGRSGTSGFADERHVGLLHRSAVFVALYVLDGNLQFRVANACVTLKGTDTAARRKGLAPFTKRFLLSDYRGAVYAVNYWWTDAHPFPDESALDLFWYVASELKAELDRDRFIHFWTLKQSGLNTIQASRKLDPLGWQRYGGAT